MGLPNAEIFPYLPPMAEEVEEIVPDSELRGLARRLPAAWRPYWMLARLDRPIGAWLLFWPGAWAVALAGHAVDRWDLIAWMGLGAIVMRGAGCVYNDIVDRDLDRKVARTAARPLASGRVSLRAAWAWLGLLCLIGLLILVQFNLKAAIAAVASLGAVAAYPFMKRITWWPQAWLGIVFSWAALVGWPAVTNEFGPALWLLYAGSIFWVIGYDTIYALQDIEDDALCRGEVLGARARAACAGRRGAMLCRRARLLVGGAVAGAATTARPRRAAADRAASGLAGLGAEDPTTPPMRWPSSARTASPDC